MNFITLQEARFNFSKPPEKSKLSTYEKLATSAGAGIGAGAGGMFGLQRSIKNKHGLTKRGIAYRNKYWKYQNARDAIGKKSSTINEYERRIKPYLKSSKRSMNKMARPMYLKGAASGVGGAIIGGGAIYAGIRAMKNRKKSGN